MALFAVLVIILAVSPRIVNNIYSSFLGRFLLIAIVVFFSMHNVTLGLLVALSIIAASNQYGSFTEGFESPVTVGEENVPITGSQKVLTKSASDALNSSKQKVSELKANAAIGVDKEDIKNAIMAKDSKTIQTDPNMMKNEDVNAFKPSMLTNSTSLTEGFCPCAASVF